MERLLLSVLNAKKVFTKPPLDFVKNALPEMLVSIAQLIRLNA
jgi:Golgi nucleoside diphosphatase